MDISMGSSSMSRSSGGMKKCDCGLPTKIFTSKTEKNPDWKLKSVYDVLRMEELSTANISSGSIKKRCKGGRETH
ncbi:unnamed protein product [Arabidopsis lyrata]|nr:unnamed protein product [Arabidopsis lyrata]